MRVLLFGGSGQLGLEVRARARDLNFEVISPVSSEVDITEHEVVVNLIREVKPHVIVNSAAYTAVDLAEAEPEKAYSINRDGACYVAEGAAQVDALCIYVSTDYVFAGDTGVALTEESVTSPLNVYGASKREGEKAVLSICGEKAVVVRTSSLFGQYGSNFVKTILKLLEERGEVKVVQDQTMSPTWAGWLSEVVIDIARKAPSGVVHATCSGTVSWYEFAKEALELSRPFLRNGGEAKVLPTTAEAFKRPAPRPRHSALDCSRLEGILGRKALPWREGLIEYLKEVYKVDKLN
jgi:dTDP-4-dehydrorhamnose reductase